MVSHCLQVFLDLDFTLMEMNPFTLDSEGKPFPLDMRGELDDTAAFKSGKKCASRSPTMTSILWNMTTSCALQRHSSLQQ